MRFIVLTFLSILFVPGLVSAQSIGGLVDTSSAFTVSVNPQYPAPYSQASLSFLSSSIDLANATLSISLAGKNVYRGSVKPYALTLGKAGSTTNIAVTISSGGTDYDQTLSIQPQDVVLVAEPLSSVPVLYPGKALVPLEGSVRVVAMANLRSAGGSALDPATLSYSWSVDGVQIANSSGIGKSSILVASPLQYRSRTVVVTVTSSGGSVVGGSTISFTAKEPVMRTYESDPLLGVRFERALLGTYSITEAEKTLFAVPFSLATTQGAPLIEWFLNGEVSQTGPLITLRPAGAGKGKASLSVVASSGSYAKATKSISLSFGVKETSNLFGL